ncbi:hypothetical protein [uncultured Draconibacterium sp.]|uniref:hypothetical protein n=1 Tax=uncultured Draconibacterium sp. TaxID=1573823 RepID=UPI0025E06823|nr:hypothetical protein [uncultured Draconibacterium sp.]
MRNIAIPIANNEITPQLCRCSHMLVCNIENSPQDFKIVEAPDFNNKEKMLVWVKQTKITDLIIHRTTRDLVHFFASIKLNLFIGVPLQKPTEIIEAYRCGKLESDKNIIKQITE